MGFQLLNGDDYHLRLTHFISVVILLVHESQTRQVGKVSYLPFFETAIR
jgi:hypothetical protein